MCLFWAHEKKGMSMHIKYVQWEVTDFVDQKKYGHRNFITW